MQSWLGLFGVWLLFAGPIFQATLELRSVELERERIQEVRRGLGKPKVISRWWWLVPPLYWYFSRREVDRYRKAIIDALHPDDVAPLAAFFNKATGWLIVALGGFLLALKETLGFTSSPLVATAIIVGATAASIGFTIRRIRSTDEMIEKHR